MDRDLGCREVLYNKWRPRRFEDVVGQARVVKVLRAYIDSGYNTSIIFSGPYGCGKTTLTKIMAAQYHDNQEAIWNNNHPAVLQLNAANRTGVKEVASLLDTVQYKPLTGTNKTYIIDEFHALSQAAFNVFLEALENLPASTRFFFATTEVHKIPDTVLSRCFVLNIDPVPPEDILARITQIAQAEGIELSESVLRLIANNSNGSVRDAVKYLDQAAMLGANPALQEVEQLLELPPQGLISAITSAIRDGDYAICDAKLPAVHPYRILIAVIKQVQSFSDREKWVPVINALTESIETTRFGLDADLILKISISKAIYVYKLAQGITISGSPTQSKNFEHKVREFFPDAIKEE